MCTYRKQRKFPSRPGTTGEFQHALWFSTHFVSARTKIIPHRPRGSHLAHNTAVVHGRGPLPTSLPARTPRHSMSRARPARCGGPAAAVNLVARLRAGTRVVGGCQLRTPPPSLSRPSHPRVGWSASANMYMGPTASPSRKGGGGAQTPEDPASPSKDAHASPPSKHDKKIRVQKQHLVLGSRVGTSAGM